jgi:hypothetical protein
MVGRLQSLVLMLAGITIPFAPAMACTFSFPTCISQVNGRESERVDQSKETPGMVIFVERSADSTSLAKVFLVDCGSRQGVSADLPAGSDYASATLEKTVAFFVEAATTPSRTYSLQQIRRSLKAEGLRARVSRLPDGHCGCTLASFQAPLCPDDHG